MDGALPSVVRGLVDVPVVPIPMSVGDGMSLSGMSALLTMLNSCSPGVGVVNVDNGFGGVVWALKCLRSSRNKVVKWEMGPCKCKEDQLSTLLNPGINLYDAEMTQHVLEKH
eukprot:CCRYP_020666-RA/>CCRYP_020666-RA protein AED:0.45 eAED:0.08 QI:0/-1/0/1/-1/1/1/0/111